MMLFGVASLPCELDCNVMPEDKVVTAGDIDSVTYKISRHDITGVYLIPTN
jgi:hypothetical protein